MLILGLGLGLVMQVLVLAAQNAVDYRLLGVATSGATLFSQIGGSIGVSVFGAIFTNGWATSSPSVSRPACTRRRTRAPPSSTTCRPRSTRCTSTAVAAALHPVFLTASTVMVGAFGLSWLLRDVPLRETAGSGRTRSRSTGYLGGASRARRRRSPPTAPPKPRPAALPIGVRRRLSGVSVVVARGDIDDQVLTGSGEMVGTGGSRSVKTEPPPSAAPTVTVPPWASATWRTMASPRPEPGSVPAWARGRSDRRCGEGRSGRCPVRGRGR